MATVNKNYLRLQGSYLFSRIGEKVRNFQSENPDKKVRVELRY